MEMMPLPDEVMGEEEEEDTARLMQAAKKGKRAGPSQT